MAFPDVGGIQITKQLLEEDDNASVVVTYPVSAKHLATEAQRAGAFCVAKPFQRIKLLEKMAGAMLSSKTGFQRSYIRLEKPLITHWKRPGLLSRKLNTPFNHATSLNQSHKAAYRGFWGFVDRTLVEAHESKRLSTIYGWPLNTRCGRGPQFQNFPIQANAAEMLYVAVRYVQDAGITVVATIHDAIAIEAAEEDLDDHVDRARKEMERASRDVLDGFTITCTPQVVKWPERYSPKKEKAAEMWATILELLEGCET